MRQSPFSFLLRWRSVGLSVLLMLSVIRAHEINRSNCSSTTAVSTNANPTATTTPSDELTSRSSPTPQPTISSSFFTSSTIPSPSPTTSLTIPTTTEEPEKIVEGEEIENFQADLSALLPSNYVSYQLPILDGAQFIPVFVSLFITGVADIDEKGGQITLDTHFSRRWLDYKISKRITGPLKNATLGPEALDRIWKPDLFFDGTPPMEKEAADATLKTVRILFNTSDLKDAQIAFSERTRLKLDCSMQFHYYPADTQVCTYHLRSFSYKQNRLKLFWETPNSLFLRDPGHPNFDLLVDSVWPNIATNGSNKLFVEETFDPFRKGNYSALTFTIKARRKLSYHLVQTYLPSILLIFMTWLCFLLPASMIEARIGISMTTVLTLTAMFASVREQAPIVSYTMAIDIWMVFSIFTVFVALLLFIFIYWMKTRAARKNEKELSNAKRRQSLDGINSFETDFGSDVNKQYSLLLRLTKYYGFFVFAFAFAVFVAVYWWWLLIFSNYFGWDPSPEFNAVEDDDDGDDDAKNKPYFHFYRYLIEDAALLFDSEIYHPAARDTLRKVFGLIK